MWGQKPVPRQEQTEPGRARESGAEGTERKQRCRRLPILAWEVNQHVSHHASDLQSLPRFLRPSWVVL